MPTNLQIDDSFLERAKRVGGFRTKKETVNEAFAEFVRRREQRKFIELFGTVDFDPQFDHKTARSRR
ncbi:MAG TPA: type II toxin-antitoxin system VapB family antitoxin [Opitutaceae bacterium]